MIESYFCNLKSFIDWLYVPILVIMLVTLINRLIDWLIDLLTIPILVILVVVLSCISMAGLAGLATSDWLINGLYLYWWYWWSYCPVPADWKTGLKSITALTKKGLYGTVKHVLFAKPSSKFRKYYNFPPPSLKTC